MKLQAQKLSVSLKVAVRGENRPVSANGSPANQEIDGRPSDAGGTALVAQLGGKFEIGGWDGFVLKGCQILSKA